MSKQAGAGFCALAPASVRDRLVMHATATSGAPRGARGMERARRAPDAFRAEFVSGDAARWMAFVRTAERRQRAHGKR
eukprot:4912040-Pleurochrysis_carterae.AAC.13